jgi:hypothetical protein
MDRMAPNQSLICITEILALFSSLLRLHRARDGFHAALQCDPDQSDQRLIVERFSQKADGSGSHGMFFNSLFLVGGNEDNRHIHSGAVHALLDLQTSHSRHLHINYRTIRIIRSAQCRKKLLAGCKRSHLHTPGVQQTPQRYGHRGVIIDDMDEWTGVRQSIVPLRLASKRRFLKKQLHDHCIIRKAGRLDIGP